jgi:N-acetylmuramoyl-L-alanine amidase
MLSRKFLSQFLILVFLILLPIFRLYADTPTRLPDGQVRILLVPGHDNEKWGAENNGIKEADMNLAVANQILSLLKKDKRFDVQITRDEYGYTKEFSDYLTKGHTDIINFKETAKKIMQANILSGTFVQKTNPPHHSVSEDIADRLYGFNKWANEHNIDAMIHIHFNDYPRDTVSTTGKYSGFAIYVPEAQMPNSKESTNLAKSIFSEISQKYHVSTYEKESAGVVPDQKLIALGANDTLLPNVRSVLIEYGYIYEKKFRTYPLRLKNYQTMAQYTATGIHNYFFPTSP